MSQLPRYHVPRQRLTDALRAASVGVVTGGGGYGKSLLALELGQALGVPTIAATIDQPETNADLMMVRLRASAAHLGLSDVTSRMDRHGKSDPTARFAALIGSPHVASGLIVIDEVQNASADAVEAIVAVVPQLQKNQRLLLIGRQLPPGLDEVLASDRTAVLGTPDLALTDLELAALWEGGFGLELTEGELKEICASTEGWLAAVLLIAGRAATADDDDGQTVVASVVGPDPLDHLLNDILARLPAADQAALGQVAHLPFVDDDLVAAATGVDGVMGRARSAGLPVSIGPAQWCQLIGPVRDRLRSRSLADHDVLIRAAKALAARGEPALAADLLMSAGDTDAAAELLSALTLQEAERINYVEFAGLADRLPDGSVARHPRLLIHLAHIAGPAAMMGLRIAALDRAQRLVDAEADPPMAREIGAELARNLCWEERVDEAEAMASRLLTQTGLGEELTRARLLEVLGRVATFQKDDVHLGYAEERLQIAARIYRAHGQWSWLSTLMLPLALWVNAARGAFEEALDCLDQGMALVSHDRLQRGVVLTFRAELLIGIGRYDEAADNLLEAQEIATSTDDPRLRAYVEWSRAGAASQQGNIEQTRACLEATEAASSEWFDVSGGEFLAQAADFLDRLGLTEEAHGYLARARQHPNPTDATIHRSWATMLARHGDPLEAEPALRDWLAAPWFEPRELWLVTLLRAHTAARGGSGDAGRLAAEAFAQAAKLGYPQLPLIREPAVSEELMALAAASGQWATGDVDRGLPVVLSLLGGFEITQGGNPLDVPPGQGRQLLKLIGSSGGGLPAEQAIEHLWPEADPEVGANRLRTVLNRLRDSVGDLIVREDRSLRLAPHVRTDHRRFEENARRAQQLAATAPAEAVSIARGALAIYRGDLLPDDPYESWATMPRERLRRHALALLDICSDAATDAGDFDEAVRCLVRATDIAPYEEERYLTIARHLLAQGRRGSARSYVDRAHSVLDELSLSAPAALNDLDRLVRQV